MFIHNHGLFIYHNFISVSSVYSVVENIEVIYHGTHEIHELLTSPKEETSDQFCVDHWTDDTDASTIQEHESHELTRMIFNVNDRVISR